MKFHSFGQTRTDYKQNAQMTKQNAPTNTSLKTFIIAECPVERPILYKDTECTIKLIKKKSRFFPSIPGNKTKAKLKKKVFIIGGQLIVKIIFQASYGTHKDIR